jgi:adenylosuccinate lyase
MTWTIFFNPKTFIGRAPEQVEEFLRLEVTPALEPYMGSMQEGSAEIRV